MPNSAVKWKRLPEPGSLSTQIRPFIICTRRDDIANPRPLPPCFRVVDASACTNASKIASLLLRRNSDARIGDREMEQRCQVARGLHPHLYADLAALGELHGVAAQIQ